MVEPFTEFERIMGRMGWGSVEGVSVGVHAFESRGRQKLR